VSIVRVNHTYQYKNKMKLPLSDANAAWHVVASFKVNFLWRTSVYLTSILDYGGNLLGRRKYCFFSNGDAVTTSTQWMTPW